MKWISVKDRLPEKQKLVLATDGKNYCLMTHDSFGFGHYTCEWCNVNNYDVTHWMPLPEKPEC